MDLTPDCTENCQLSAVVAIGVAKSAATGKILNINVLLFNRTQFLYVFNILIFTKNMK